MMCNCDQRICAEAIIKDKYIYIVDDFFHFAIFSFNDFEAMYSKYSSINCKADKYFVVTDDEDRFIKLKKSELQNIYKKYKELK